MERIKRIQLWLYLIVIITLIISGVYSSSLKNKEILKNKALTSGTITGYSFDKGRGHNGVYVYYEYIVNNKKIQDKFLWEYRSDSFVGLTFPVIYNQNDIESNRMLILPDDFANFNLDFPDSLKWVVKSCHPY